MTTRVALSHHLSYVFHRQVNPTTLWLRLRPAPHTTAQVEAYSIKVHAEPNWLTWVRDPFENHLGRLDLPEPFSRIGFDVDFIANLEPVNPFDFFVEPFANDYPFTYPDQLRKELTPYLRRENSGPAFSRWLGEIDCSGSYLVDFLTRLNEHVHAKLTVQSPTDAKPIDLEAVVNQGGGSPWDLAWVLTQSLRGVGLAARFTSGYLLSPAINSEGSDHASLHAWSEVFAPGAGWIGLDPSLGIFTAENHVPLASAPEPFRTVPLVGNPEHLVEQCHDEVRLRRLLPVSPSKPVSETHWRDINAAARYLDHDLDEQQLTLCSSAEVNFVSADSDGSAEWTDLTLGDDKRRAAQALLSRLKAKWAPGGTVHISQGEHFRGEATARWRLSCYFRADGRPLWRNAATLASGQATTRRVTTRDAQDFLHELAGRLGISKDFVIAAHEDRLHELWTRPALFNYTPQAAELKDPLQRQALANHISVRQGEPAGYVLPLRWDPIQSGWASGQWKFRRSGLYLLPGDFPIGFRLPLDSLSKETTEPNVIPAEPSPFEDKPLLAEVYGEASARHSTVGPAHQPPAAADSGQNGLAPRTALCVEARDDGLHIFLPPIQYLEHYAELIAAIEATAQTQPTPVVLEGYDPPQDHRLKRFVFEPDSGLLRLFLPAASSWQEQSELYEIAYAEAAAAGLQAEHGGERDDVRQRPNRDTTLTLGGPTAATSPFLNRPALLRSLITFWQNHPCLSYLFSGTQVGPSGNAPRPDEGRDDALYELGIALSRFPRDSSPHPWVPDRLLRHLLADASGDMHRAEIRVDQLYAPERQSRRLGQIMLHSFDMPPDFKLASLQALLVRALVAYFSRRPYAKPLIAWDSALHDRFMLPQILWDDFGTILGELGEAGLPLQQAWFAPILDMNFPQLGRVKIGDITLELRRAHEPWPLLAEEATAGGVARFIDVANERLQVRVSGLAPDRYVLACNQQSVPLHQGGIQGQYVAGVRYKVFQPPSTLHPTVAPTTALVFDLIDTWTGKAIGGCTYYPTPPRTWAVGPTGTPTPVDRSGREPATPARPMTLAASPVSGRFTDSGSGIGPMALPNQRDDRRFPYLLDLTKVAIG